MGTTGTRLEERRPDVVFNLVESLGGTDRLAALATLLLDARQIAYTGSRTEALLATADKVAAKQRLLEAGLPTPGWLAIRGQAVSSGGLLESSPVILKSVWEHASLGLEADAILPAGQNRTALVERLRLREAATRRPHLAEQYIDGREFNLSVLAGRGSATSEDGTGYQVLPPAEIDFSAFAPGQPRIVGYRAKWDEQSFEYHHTPRRFDFPASDAGLLERLSNLAASCWEQFALGGYVRVDFRVDGDGQPWILEINTNPCLSPDAGFAAALEQAGIEYEQAIQRILDDALQRSV